MNHAALPRSEPTIWNATLVGSRVGPQATAQVQRGMVLRRGTAAHLYNHVIMGLSTAAVDVRDRATWDLASAGSLFIRGSMFFENGSGGAVFTPRGAAFDAFALFTRASEQNAMDRDPRLGAPYERAHPNFAPAVGSPVFSAGETPPDDGFFDARATFVGAIGSEDWTQGWTAFPIN